MSVMDPVSDRAWIVVLGATGYAGRLVCRALRRRNVRFAIAGRDARKLALLGEALGGVEQCVVDLESPVALRELLDRRLLVCACAGPFAEVGEPVLAAAAELGVHYVDVCQEQPFTHRSFQRFDAAARASKACVVPSMAFESAPADWAASLLAERLGGTLDELDIVYVVRVPPGGPASSRGSLRSTFATLAQGESRQHVGGALRAEHDAMLVRRFETRIAGEITAASFAGAEAVLVPAHVPVKQVRTYRAVAPMTARALQVTRWLGPMVARAGRGTLDRLLRYASEGPDIAARASTQFEVLVQARRGDARARAHVTGADPYQLTAEIQAHAAEAALAGYVEACGVVPPSVGYPALAAFANLADVLRVEILGDQLAPVRPLRSLRPVRAPAPDGRHAPGARARRAAS
jgi:short subunit dehydrogenase-like uncharacterized protein